MSDDIVEVEKKYKVGLTPNIWFAIVGELLRFGVNSICLLFSLALSCIIFAFYYFALIRFCRPLLLDESGLVFQQGACEVFVRKHENEENNAFGRLIYLP